MRDAAALQRQYNLFCSYSSGQHPQTKAVQHARPEDAGRRARTILVGCTHAHRRRAGRAAGSTDRQPNNPKLPFLDDNCRWTLKPTAAGAMVVRAGSPMSHRRPPSPRPIARSASPRPASQRPTPGQRPPLVRQDSSGRVKAAATPLQPLPPPLERVAPGRPIPTRRHG